MEVCLRITKEGTFLVLTMGSTSHSLRWGCTRIEFFLLVVADRQRIVEVFPSTHRGAFVARKRQRIVEVGGGAGTVLHRSLPL